MNSHISKPIIAGNFKANLTRDEVTKYANTLDTYLSTHLSQSKIYIFPSLTALLLDDFTHFHIGAQNAYPTLNGSFTGEVGLSQLQEFHISRLIIGHSERREICRESNDLISKKCRFYMEAGFEIFYCIGENAKTREKGLGAVIDYLASQLDGIDTSYERLIIAYEPIWAIGTGESASVEQITNTHKAIKTLANIPLLYGGSVNEKNAKSILSIPNVDGILVGSASLKVEQFIDIIARASL